MSAVPSYWCEDATDYSVSSAAVLPLSFQDSHRGKVDRESDGDDSLYLAWKRREKMHIDMDISSLLLPDLCSCQSYM